MMAVGHAELYEKVAPCGDIERSLMRHLGDLNETHLLAARLLAFRSLGDSPAVELKLNLAASAWTERPALAQLRLLQR